MNKFNLKQAEQEIRKKATISDKLDYWKSIIDEYVNRPLIEQFGEKYPEEQERAIIKQLFGNDYELIPPLLIPKQIYNEHFNNGLNEPEFTYWFLKYNAQKYFDTMIKPNLPDFLNSINLDLDKLNAFEKEAEQLYKDDIINIYYGSYNSDYKNQIEFIRIKKGYYKKYTLQDVQQQANKTVILYAKHIYLKDILEKELNKTLPPQQRIKEKPDLNETGLSEKIKKHFNFFQSNCPRKHKQILKEEDFNKLIQWTIQYFENEFKVPKISDPIKVVNTNKTFVQLAFKYLFKELHKSSPYPNTLFEFYRNAFKPFSEDKKSNFEAVKNNDEVKKLMLLDY